MTKHRLLLLAWIGLAGAFALMPLQWSDPNRLLYAAVGCLLVVVQTVRCVLRWNKPDA